MILPNLPAAHSPELLEQLRALDTSSIADAIERTGVRMRNEGFANNLELKCRFPELPPMVGYAATVRVRSGNPPIAGSRYPEAFEWWSALEKLPQPFVLAIEDIDRHPGTGAFIGETHAALFQAMGCAGVVTNGAVRSLPQIAPRRLPIFSRIVSPSHAYVHVVAVGVPVQLSGLAVTPGELLHGDCQGIVRIPHAVAPQLPAIAQELHAWKQRLLALCDAPDFSRDAVRAFLSSRD
jgi:regulator of RNase E activity RraA